MESKIVVIFDKQWLAVKASVVSFDLIKCIVKHFRCDNLLLDVSLSGENAFLPSMFDSVGRR